MIHIVICDWFTSYTDVSDSKRYVVRAGAARWVWSDRLARCYRCSRQYRWQRRTGNNSIHSVSLLPLL